MTAQLQRGGRLPPTPGPNQGPAPQRDMLSQYGNAALLDMLLHDPQTCEGDMGITRFEDIGESDDEIDLGHGALVPGVGDNPYGGFLHGAAAVDDAALKLGLGIYEDEHVGFANVDGQAGFWWDDDDNWNLGVRAGAEGLRLSHDFIGDQSEDDGYFRVRGQLGDASGAARVGSDGGEFGLSAGVATGSIAAGTGFHDDSWTDWAAEVSGSLVSGGAGFGMWMSDVDGDDISELNLSLGLDVFAGLGVDVSSEPVGYLYDQCREWFGGWVPWA